MSKSDNSANKTNKRSRSKKHWREIEEIRDRYALMRELQENDYCLELEIDDLAI